MLRIRDLRKESDLTQQQLAVRLGVSRSTIAMWETGGNDPDADSLVNMANLFNCSVDYLLGRTDVRVDEDLLDRVNELPQELLEQQGSVLDAQRAVVSFPPERLYSPDALALAADYDALDDYGRKAIRAVADVEKERRAQEIAQQKAPILAPVTYIRVKRYDDPAAAGAPVWAESGYTLVQYPENVVPKGTDYAVGISGHSMEPDYPDGCTVFVRSTQTIQDKDVVLAWMDGEGAVCKRAVFNDVGHIIRLESINRNFEDYTLRQLLDMRIMGKVLGYVMG